VGVKSTADKLHSNEQLEVLTQQIIRARIYYDLWWFYAGDKTRPEIVDTLNDFPEFFRFEIHAHFVAMIVHCCTIVDKTADTISLKRIADALLDPKRFQDDRLLLDRVAKAVANAEGLQKIRHKAIAHRSDTFNYASTFKEAAVTPDCIPVLLSEFLDLANELRRKLRLQDADFNPLALEHIKSLIHVIGGPDLRPHNDLGGLFEA
jgi:hypothetical protein